MLSLNNDECRVLGTMIEKAQTTPAQYPLTLNGLTNGCNQKNNRDPVTNFTEEDSLNAVDSLRFKGLVREAMLSGSRVAKYRHVSREVLAVNTEELVILAELWLRGPQSAGELRSNASRMVPLASLESVQALLTGLVARPEPYVKELPRRPGERATRFVQLFCADLHPLDGPIAAGGEHGHHAVGGGGSGGSGGATRSPLSESQLNQRVERLEAELRELKLSVEKLVAAIGGP